MPSAASRSGRPPTQKSTWSLKMERPARSSVQKIAIANPEHAPYGRAAVDALKHAGIYDKVQSKLVFGENISQAAQFVQSGNAQAGIIALSLAISPAMKSGQAMGECPSIIYHQSNKPRSS